MLTVEDDAIQNNFEMSTRRVHVFKGSAEVF